MAVSGSAFRQINFYPTGNVGVGTTQPSEILHVMGDAFFDEGSISGSYLRADSTLAAIGDVNDKNNAVKWVVDDSGQRAYLEVAGNAKYLDLNANTNL